MRTAAALVTSVVLLLIGVALLVTVQGGPLIDGLRYALDQSPVLLPPALATGVVTAVLSRWLGMVGQTIVAVPLYLVLVNVAGDIYGRLTWIEPMGLFYVYYAGPPSVALFVLLAVVLGRLRKRARAEGSARPEGSGLPEGSAPPAEGRAQADGTVPPG